MSLRPAWTIKNGIVIGKEFEFQWNGGFAITQKQKNIKNLHQSIEKNKGGCCVGSIYQEHGPDRCTAKCF